MEKLVTMIVEVENEAQQSEKSEIISSEEAEVAVTKDNETNKKPSFFISKEDYHRILGELKEKHPNIFGEGEEVKPLSIGIHKQLLEDTDESKSKIRKFLNKYTRSKQYKKSLIENANRYDLDGTVAGIVSEEHVEEAKKHLRVKKQKNVT